MNITAEHKNAMQELTELIARNPKGYLNLVRSLHEVPARNHAQAVVQAIVLAHKFPEFAIRFEKEVGAVHHFNGFRLFAAIFTGGASEIAYMAAAAVKKHDAAVIAKQQELAQAQGKATPPPLPDPIASQTPHPAVVPPPAAAQAAPPPPKKEEGFIAKNKGAVIGGSILLFGIICFVIYRVTRPAEKTK